MRKLLLVLVAATPLCLRAQVGPGSCLSYNGTAQAVTIHGFGTNAPTTEVTVEFWQNVTAIRQQFTFDLNPNNDSDRFSAHIPWSNGNIYWDFGNISGAGRLQYLPTNSIIGTWQHFALVASQSGNYMRIYRNGVLEAQTNSMTPFSRYPADLELGSSLQPYLGQLDEFRIWNVARSQSQIQSNMNRTLTLPQPNLVAYWRLDEGAGTTANDSSGNGYTGTLTGAPAWTVSSVPFAPDLVTGGAASITSSNSTLNGSVNPGNLATTAWFQWGTTISYGTNTIPITLSATNSALTITNTISGLAPGATYHFRLVATNSNGTTFGTDSQFTTLAPLPTVTTLSASGMTAAIAYLNGTVNPNGYVTAAWFDFGVTTNYGSNTATNSVGSANSSIAVSQALFGLAPGTTYHFRVAATNTWGTSHGSDQAFTTLSTNALLAALTLSSGPLTPTFSSNLTSYAATVPNSTNTVMATPTSADTNATIFVRVNGGNLIAVSSGSPSASLFLNVGHNEIDIWVYAQDDATITAYTITITRTAPPVVSTLGPLYVTGTSATLSGGLTTYSPTATWFDWGTTTNYGNHTVTNALDYTVLGYVSASVTGLVQNTTYHFRVVASNSDGVAYGADFSFLTPFGAPYYPEAYTFSTLAGFFYANADGAGSTAHFAFPQGVAVDTNGNVYVADSGHDTIRMITPAGVVTTLAGFTDVSGSADGTNSAARFNSPEGVALDSAGNLYVADFGNYTIRRMNLLGTNWVVTTIAGLAGQGGAVDGTNSEARFDSPMGITVDSGTNLYVAEFDYSIRKIALAGSNWVVITIATLPSFPVPEGSPFKYPRGIAVDTNGSLYVSTLPAIWQVSQTGTNWVVTAIAGSNQTGSADGTNGTARFTAATGVALDTAGNIYVGDTGLATVRKITPMGTNWVVTTMAGTNGQFVTPTFVAVDTAGNVYEADSGDNTIGKITSAGLAISLAGDPESGSGSADGTGTAARFSGPTGVAIDRAGYLDIADNLNYTIRQVTSAGVVSTIAGSAMNYGYTNGVGATVRFTGPWGVAVDKSRNVYVTDAGNNVIRKISSAGVVSTVAGSIDPGSTDDIGTAASFHYPLGIAVDGATNLYVADTYNFTIRQITPDGRVTTIAGSAGNAGSVDGTNSDALFQYPAGIAVDNSTNLYVADWYNNAIRKLSRVGSNLWSVTTIAGAVLNRGYADGMGTAAQFNGPQAVGVDSVGNVYVADTGNSVIRKVLPFGTNWIVGTIGGLAGSVGTADGAGSLARFYHPSGLCVDAAGNVYVADTDNNTIRKGTFIPAGPTNPVAFTPPAMNGSLVVTLNPTNANGQWRFPWEFGWRNSGQAATNLAAGDYGIQCRDVPGWTVVPFPNTVSVTNNGTTSVTNQYYPSLSSPDATSGGTLTVNIGPSPPSGAGWHFIGDSSPPFPPGYPTFFTTNLLPGTYLIEFAPVSGYSKPSNLSVEVVAGRNTLISVNYTLAAARPDQVFFPFPVPPSNISNLNAYPFGFNGQLQTDAGYGSGVVVTTNVVLTAAHLVFNDQTLTYVSQAYWFFEQEAGVYSPQPLTNRGCYVLSGYAAQRTNDFQHHYGIDESSPASRNLDVAAIFFQNRVPWTGYGGYLPSDIIPNPWLAGNSLKMLVGYPVDGSLFGDTTITNGVMYQTDPQPYQLSLATDQVNGQQEVYTAPWFLSYPGNSGGPLYVQLNGYFYPAAVYLGTFYNGSTYQSLVRAINGDVVNLITNAATLGTFGGNSVGGGVITFVANGSLSPTNSAWVQVFLGPPSALGAGAGWRLHNDSTFGTNPTNCFSSSCFYTREVTTNGASIEFKPLPGWDPPANQTNSLTPGLVNIFTNFYTIPASLTVSPATNLVFTGYTGGPFSPPLSYTLTNSGQSPLAWSILKNDSWLGITPSSGTIGANAAATVSFSILPGAVSNGIYSDTLIFTNQVNGLGTTIRGASLSVATHPPVQFVAASRITNGVLALTLTGLVNQPYAILSSTNILLPMSAWGTNLLLTNSSAGQITFTNPPSTNKQLYLRARELH
ncbi:MAG: hypothetical protein C5B50_00080 [Verrucomicrobia bacterium]|nr:MAG: hypothetical protein C5B50_00080 [Verrucomicrobiota bacterium]